MTQMNLEGILLSEMSQSQEKVYDSSYLRF